MLVQVDLNGHMPAKAQPWLRHYLSIAKNITADVTFTVKDTTADNTTVKAATADDSRKTYGETDGAKKCTSN